VTSPLNVLIVDDERPAIDELRYLLELNGAIGSVSEASSASEAIRAMETTTFDAVFLDIEMPDTTGLDLARRMTEVAEGSHRPVVVFVTAFEQHAVVAFEVEAVDYVLKPVRAERLAHAVRRIQTVVGPSENDTEQEAAFGSRFGVDVGGKTIFVDRSSVMVVEASRDYVRLHTSDRYYLLRTPISVLDAAWSAFGFVRVHRSYLVAIDHVREMRTDDSGTVLSIGSLEIPVSRTYARDLKQRLLNAGRQHRPSEKP
jgi:DNA-binding LytR/AlgR family response regulator